LKKEFESRGLPWIYGKKEEPLGYMSQQMLTDGTKYWEERPAKTRAKERKEIRVQ
jgi:hypothetical protein